MTLGIAELLEFDTVEHAYSIDGVTLPSVTRIMASQFPLNVPKERLEFARQMGKAIHSATELYDRHKLDWPSLDPKIVPYVEAWVKFRRDTNCEILAIEERLHHLHLHYAGTLDRIVLMLGAICVLDLKRPVLGPRVGVQLAAYQRAYNIGRAHPASKRFGLQLKNDGNYRLREYKDEGDWTVFMACLSIYNWKVQHGEV